MEGSPPFLHRWLRYLPPSHLLLFLPYFLRPSFCPALLPLKDLACQAMGRSAHSQLHLCVRARKPISSILFSPRLGSIAFLTRSGEQAELRPGRVPLLPSPSRRIAFSYHVEFLPRRHRLSPINGVRPSPSLYRKMDGCLCMCIRTQRPVL